MRLSYVCGCGDLGWDEMLGRVGVVWQTGLVGAILVARFP